MMRRSAGFHADEARRQLLKEWQNVPALELTANDYITCRVNCVDLKNRLSDIETNCRDRLHVWLLRIVGALNSTHIHGTSVPVEEPSTASKADSCTAAYNPRAPGLFDLIVGARELEATVRDRADAQCSWRPLSRPPWARRDSVPAGKRQRSFKPVCF